MPALRQCSPQHPGLPRWVLIEQGCWDVSTPDTSGFCLPMGSSALGKMGFNPNKLLPEADPVLSIPRPAASPQP